jgi:hypothetical protein
MRTTRRTVLALAVFSLSLLAAKLSEAQLLPGGFPFIIPWYSGDVDLMQDPNFVDCNFQQKVTMIGVQGTAIPAGVTVDVWRVSYVSRQYYDGVARNVVIRGFAAVPRTVPLNPVRPGVVYAHGLGGYAVQLFAVQLAAALDSAVIVYSGPGEPTATSAGWYPCTFSGVSTTCAGSNGRGHYASDGYVLFDTLTNDEERGTWFWGHALAGMGATTCLQEFPENRTDGANIGFAGLSAGGLATLINASLDDRVDAAVVQSASFSFETAVENDDNWMHALLADAGLTIDSQEWAVLVDSMFSDSLLLAENAPPVLLINGSVDEFFPLNAWRQTYDELDTVKRASLAANFDHGCYAIDQTPYSGVDTWQQIFARTDARLWGGARAWFSNFLKAAPISFVSQPSVTVTRPTSTTTRVAPAFPIAWNGYEASDAVLWVSTNQGRSFHPYDLYNRGGTVQTKNYIGNLLPGDAVYFMDVEYTRVGRTAPGEMGYVASAFDRPTFSVSTRPVFADPNVVLSIRPLSSCTTSP